MMVDRETLQAMIKTYRGFELSDAEMDLVELELQSYFDASEKMNDLDLSDLPSARLSRASEGSEI